VLATLIVIMLGAGVVAAVAKNNKTTPTAKPAVTASPVETPTVSPSTSVPASRQTPAPANVPPTPVTGVGRYPAGFVFVALAGVLALWLRRSARV
jgi:hypothetical protein